MIDLRVPEVTLYFWIIKVLCTTVGETAADFLNTNLNLGLTGTTFVMSAVLAVALVFQFRVQRYVPGIYWLAVVLISVVGRTLDLTSGAGYVWVTGRLTQGIALDAASVVAFDPDAASVAGAQASLPAEPAERVAFTVALAEEIEIERGAFDLVVFSWSL